MSHMEFAHLMLCMIIIFGIACCVIMACEAFIDATYQRSLRKINKDKHLKIVHKWWGYSTERKKGATKC